jgi:hypothetical protein
MSEGNLSSDKIRIYSSKNSEWSLTNVRSFLKGYQVREDITMIVHTASGMHNHGFREHKSPAIYAFFCR